jgi:uncharacterized BrkB/YihY/UPF0761 family membrane protein
LIPGGTGLLHKDATNQIPKFSHSFLEKVNAGLIAGVSVSLLLWTAISIMGQIRLSQKF